MGGDITDKRNHSEVESEEKTEEKHMHAQTRQDKTDISKTSPDKYFYTSASQHVAGGGRCTASSVMQKVLCCGAV